MEYSEWRTSNKGMYDKRIIEACGYVDGKVQAYWKEGIKS